ncbi:MAG: TVP38/TMEM64 family protein [Desulfobacterales bacterium]|nr:TVP38/TMEM64 family protein [Desulfobacterales bacterium]MBF0397101.1 TVP38/TMEM64 family protein [Desulfobacterales bacterium]
MIYFYDLLSDKEKITGFINSFGVAAPIAFIFIQIFQVIFAPIPGEVTGFIGGYIFGILKSFLFSTIGLTIGSWINFSLGRFLGEKYIQKLIPKKYYERLDKIVKHEGLIVVLIFFIFPGFPKDWMCLVLGVSHIPLKIFMLFAFLGRMPGTLMLSIKGALISEKEYGLFAIVLGISIIIVLIAYRFRDNLYLWVEKANSKK